MKYTELKNSIKEGAKPVYLLEGDDAYFRSNGEEQLKAAAELYLLRRRSA